MIEKFKFSFFALRAEAEGRVPIVVVAALCVAGMLTLVAISAIVYLP